LGSVADNKIVQWWVPEAVVTGAQVLGVILYRRWSDTLQLLVHEDLART